MSTAPDLSATIARLFVYPVKSCAGVELQEAQLAETGLDLDRAWMVVDESGEFVSQRELPRMALVRPTLRLSDVVLRAPGMLALHLQIDTVEEPVRVRVWDDEVPAYDMGAVAAQWFSDFLGRKLRLVRFDPEHRRLSNLKWTEGVEAPNQFADGYPLLLAVNGPGGPVMGPKGSMIVFDGDHLAYLERTRGTILDCLQRDPRVRIMYMNMKAQRDGKMESGFR
jgi:hypothetical protein